MAQGTEEAGIEPRQMDVRGILRPGALERKFHLSRLAPSPDLHPFVEHYWIVSWDLRGQEPYTQETLPYPCAHLVFEAKNTRVYGVMLGKFARQLEGHGRVLGIKFQPAGFRPFLGHSMRLLTNHTPRYEEVFGERSDDLESAILSHQDEQAMVALAEQFLRGRLPTPDERIVAVNQIVDRIATQRDITTVDDVLVHCADAVTSKRTLQRLFSEYIGVGPKWVIRRFRLHEAAGRIDEGSHVDLARLASELGYADQMHFIKDFKAIIGETPGAYSTKRGTTS